MHAVLTVPRQLAPVALQNKKVIFNLLFHASAETLLEVARDPRHLGPRSASSASCTVGISDYCSTRIYIASWPPADWLQTMTAGSVPPAASSSPSTCSAVSSAASSSPA